MTGPNAESRAETASFYLREQLKRLRKAQNLTVDALVDRCHALGADDITINVVWNIESGRRTIAVDTALGLAAALNVPAMSLLLPPEGDAVRVTPAANLSRDRFAAWFTGSRPLPSTDASTYRAVAAELPSPAAAAERSTDTDLEARTQWWMRRIDARADHAEQRLRATMTDFADELSRHAATRDDSTQIINMLNELRGRLGIADEPTPD